MQIPKRIKIGPYTYTIEFPYNFEKHEDCRGDINYSLNRIRLDDRCEDGYSLTADRCWQTFLHEITHAVLETAQIGMDEQCVDRVATVVLDVLMSNGWLKPEIDLAESEEKEITNYREQLRDVRKEGNTK